jgi:hypothetical protein
MNRSEKVGDIELLHNRVTDAIARHRNLFFILIALLYALSFNGKWRIGLDSADYRGLALSIASGRGYTFGDWAPKQIYPGLPYSLAAIEYVLGPKDRTPSLAEQARLIGPSAATTTSVALIFACAIASLVLIYKLIRLHYPAWVATTITCGVATNCVFIEYANELFTDVPFLLAVLASLLGWDLLKRAGDRKSRLKAIALIVPGLMFAAAMRPTFWILAFAWIAVCVWGILFGRRKLHAVCLITLLAIWAMLIAIDPRYKGFHPLSGGYESEALDMIPQASTRFAAQLYHILHDQFPAGVFGQAMSPVGIASSIIVMLSTLLLLRRHALWVLMAWGTLAATMIVSSEPRYYMMVLPTLLLGWLAMLCAIARRTSRLWGEIILVVGLAIVTLNNLSASVGFFIEQHRSDFITHYKKGGYVKELEMCEVIRQHVRPDQRVLGPSGPIMSVFTGVHVYMQREIMPRGQNVHSPELVAAKHLDYCVTPGMIYHDKDPTIAHMFRVRVLVPIKMIASTSAGWHLMTLRVVVPPTDWRKLPTGWRPRPATKPATTRRATTRPKRKRPATRSTTRSSTRPMTQPTTRPASQPQDLRAMTMMLSPVLLAASGPELSAVCVYGGSLLMRDAAAATSGCGEPFEIVNFFIPKYAAAAGRASPNFFIASIK